MIRQNNVCNYLLIAEKLSTGSSPAKGEFHHITWIKIKNSAAIS